MCQGNLIIKIGPITTHDSRAFKLSQEVHVRDRWGVCQVHYLFTCLVMWRFQLIYHDREQLAENLRDQVRVSSRRYRSDQQSSREKF